MLAGATCSAVKADGARCGSRVLLPSGLCAAHDPARRAAMAAARRKGGKGKATAVRAERLIPSHMKPIFAACLAGIRDVRDGTLPANRATAIAALASAAVRVYSVGILEQRLEELEARLAQEGQGR